MRRTVGSGFRSNAALRALLVFALAWSAAGRAASGQEAGRAAAPLHVPTVPVCELLRRPERYHGKVVRFSAVQASGYHGTSMYAVCAGKTQHLSVSLDCDGEAACAKMQEPLTRVRQTHKPPSLEELVAVVAVGRFYGPSKLGAPSPGGALPPDTVSMTAVESCGYGHLGGFDYAFEVRKYERARALPSSRPWAGTREDKLEAEVLRLDFHWQLAVRDGQQDTLVLLLADEYTLTEQTGRVRDRSRLLSDLKNTAEPVRDFIPRCERFRREGRRGIVTGLLSNGLSVKEGESELVVGYTNVYERGRGKWGWQLVSTRLSALPPARLPAGANER